MVIPPPPIQNNLIGVCSRQLLGLRQKSQQAAWLKQPFFIFCRALWTTTNFPRKARWERGVARNLFRESRIGTQLALMTGVHRVEMGAPWW
jgi:hypothetical protein